MSASSSPLLIVGHFPPPVMGEAVAVESLAAEMEQRRSVVRLPTSSGRDRRDFRHHLIRSLRVLRVVGHLVSERRRTRALYLAGDAGYGIIYSIILVATARLLRYDMHLHHHSYRYVNVRSRLMAIVTLVGGNSCCHLLLCEEMRRTFASLYRGARRTDVQSVAYTSKGRGTKRPSPALRRVGHLSNLAASKGLNVVFEVVKECRHRGLDIQLVLAGPAATEADREILDAGLAELGPAVEYRGAVHGSEKAAFYRDADVFLFPSQYVNEASPLVVWEALASGVPVLATQVGCLKASSAKGGISVHRAPCILSMVDLIVEWYSDADLFRQACQEAAQLAEEARAEAVRALDELARAGHGDRS